MHKIILPRYKNIVAILHIPKLAFLIILSAIFYLLPKEYLGEKYPICIYRILFNKQCLGCGTTRAIWSVLHFKFITAFEYNKLIIITFPILIFCLVWWSLQANIRMRIREEMNKTIRYFLKEKQKQVLRRLTGLFTLRRR
jgi:hypothetical protein